MTKWYFTRTLSMTRRQLAWNFKPYFLGKLEEKKKKIKMSSAEVFTQPVDSSGDKLTIIFKENRVWHSYGNCLLQFAWNVKPRFLGKIRKKNNNVSKCLMLKFLLRMQVQQMTNWWYFSQKIGFDISCKFSPKETICMK